MDHPITISVHALQFIAPHPWCSNSGFVASSLLTAVAIGVIGGAISLAVQRGFAR
jgi:hypothetical protein